MKTAISTSTFTSMFKNTLITLGISLLATQAIAQPVNIYGPGGPAPAMKEAAATFEKNTGNKITVTSGGISNWAEKAKTDADIIYSGSEHMMTELSGAMSGKIKESSVTPLYIRPLAMLVRPGNPKHIRTVKDLTKPNIKILVVNGSGLTGAWEDMAGRKGEIKVLQKIRNNIVSFAGNSGVARDTWQKDNTIDVWITWNVWQLANPKTAQVVAIEKDYAIYRDTGVALTLQGDTNPTAKQFIAFLQSKEGEMIFNKWGWMK